MNLGNAGVEHVTGAPKRLAAFEHHRGAEAREVELGHRCQRPQNCLLSRRGRPALAVVVQSGRGLRFRGEQDGVQSRT